MTPAQHERAPDNAILPMSGSLRLPDGLSTLSPHIRLHGKVDGDMLDRFLDAADQADLHSQVVVELTTNGGDADIGRRIAQEVRLLREHRGADVAFVGKSAVYSAGVTIMAAFPPSRRFLTRDTLLLIHERRLKKTLTLDGAMRANLALVRDVLAEIESAQLLESAGFEDLVRGTSVTIEQLQANVLSQDWYVPASEAKALGLVAALI